MPKFQKKPVVVEAVQFDGFNFAAMRKFCGTHRDSADEVDINTFNPIGTYLSVGGGKADGELWVEANNAWLPIETGEWVIKDDIGFYPCKWYKFNETYERVDD